MMEQRKKLKLYANKGLDIAEYDRMKAELEKMELAVAELSSIQTTSQPATPEQ